MRTHAGVCRGGAGTRRRPRVLGVASERCCCHRCSRCCSCSCPCTAAVAAMGLHLQPSCLPAPLSPGCEPRAAGAPTIPQVLSDPKKREVYDQFGEEGLKGGMGGAGGALRRLPPASTCQRSCCWRRCCRPLAATASATDAAAVAYLNAVHFSRCAPLHCCRLQAWAAALVGSTPGMPTTFLRRWAGLAVQDQSSVVCLGSSVASSCVEPHIDMAPPNLSGLCTPLPAQLFRGFGGGGGSFRSSSFGGEGFDFFGGGMPFGGGGMGGELPVGLLCDAGRAVTLCVASASLARQAARCCSRPAPLQATGVALCQT